MDFVKLFAITVGTIVGLPTVILVGKLALGIGKKWGDIESAQAAAKEAHMETARTIGETRDAVRSLTDTVNPRLARIEFMLSGPDGENGLRGDMKEVKQRVGAIEQRIGPDRRKTPRSTPERRRKAS